MGHAAVADRKLEHGNPLVVLGIVFRPIPEGAWCKPSPEKVEKWCARLKAWLETLKMSPGDAKKMAGRQHY